MKRLILSLLFWLTVSGGAAAQDGPILLVTLKDITSHPIAGARIIVRDSAGERDIAQAITDAQGTASFAALNASDIRVAVEGQLKSGARLFQPGNDARGMLVFLRSGTTRVNLLADTDGLIAPDPRTMAALEPGIPVATAVTTIFPTALLKVRPAVTAIRALPQPPFQASAGRAADADAVGGAPTEPPPPTNPLFAWLGIALLFGCGIAILMLLRPWWRGR